MYRVLFFGVASFFGAANIMMSSHAGNQGMVVFATILVLITTNAFGMGLQQEFGESKEEEKARKLSEETEKYKKHIASKYEKDRLYTLFIKDVFHFKEIIQRQDILDRTIVHLENRTLSVGGDTLDDVAARLRVYGFAFELKENND